MARPRSISDKEIIAVAYDIVMSEGLKALTFETLGEKVYLVPAALVRRFTTKQKLLLEVDRYGLERSQAKVDEAMGKQASPIEAILAGFTTELSFATSIKKLINGQEFLLMDLADQNMYSNYQVSFQQRYAKVKELLEEAQARGELSSRLDPTEFAQFLQMILHGAGHVWAMTQDGPIEDYIHRYIQLALQPYKK